jgi:hypothetical protein
MFGMWIASTVVRKKGWKSETELDRWYGITVPLTGGVAYLIMSNSLRRRSALAGRQQNTASRAARAGEPVVIL